MKLLLIQGANMEYLGRRQPELYGTATARELDNLLRRQAEKLRVGLDIFYTNTEGEARLDHRRGRDRHDRGLRRRFLS